jgi:hypothetical protein
MGYPVPYFDTSNANPDDPSAGYAGDNSSSTPGGGFGGSVANRPYPPKVFSVAIASDGASLAFLVGIMPSPIARSPMAFFRVYFTPVALVAAANLADPTVQAAAFSSAVLVGTVPVPAKGGNASFTNSQYLNQDGWFWATTVSQANYESVPTSPFRAPFEANLVNLNYPPEVTSPALSKVGNTVNGVAVSTVTASAKVPANTFAVTAVFVTSPGTGYAAGTTVTFTGGLLTGGTVATATPIVSPTGTITEIIMGSTGALYGSAPTVTINGAGTGATAIATIALGTAWSGFQLYLTNYQGGSQVESLFVGGPNLVSGQTATGSFNLIPDSLHITTFAFVSVSAAGRRQTVASPTATLTV